MTQEPLTIKELRKMKGMPVYCPDVDGYGIVKCETIGKRKNVPFLIGVWHNDGVAVNFEYDIRKRKLKCYRIKGLEVPDAESDSD